MAITRVGTETDGDTTTTGTAISFSHTVPSGASLLLVAVHMQGDETITGNLTWDGNDMTLIHATPSSSSGDQRAWLWGYINPAATTAIIAGTTSTCEFRGIGAVNYAGTETSSVGAATNYLSEDNNTTNTSTNVHSSAGTAGRTLIVTAGWRGGDMTPTSVDNSFTEVWDRASGSASAADTSHMLGELIGGAPSAVTVTAGGSDQNAGILIELIPASVGGSTPKGAFGLPLHGPFGGPV